MKKLIDGIIEHFSDGHHVEGGFFALCGVITVVSLNIIFGKQWVKGLAGINGLWEGPEILIYIFCCWIAPFVVIATSFLDIRPPDAVWLFLGAITMFALTGRWGLEWLLALRSGNKQVITEERKVSSSTTTEITQEQKPTT